MWRRATRWLTALGKFCMRSIQDLSRGFVSRLSNGVADPSGYQHNEGLHQSSRVTISATYDGVLYNLFRGKKPTKKVLEGTYDEAIWLVYRHAVDEGDVVIDVGAGIGLHSAYLSKRVGPTGRVFAFEPVAYNIDRLNTNLHLNHCQNVSIVKAVAGPNRGRVDLWEVAQTERGLGTSSVVFNTSIRKLHERGAVKKVKVEQITLDWFVAANELEVDFVKIDVEGYDLEVLRGATSLLAKQSPTLIVEFKPPRLSDLGVRPEDYAALLLPHYQCFAVCPPNRHDRFVSFEPFAFDWDIPTGDLLCLPRAKLWELK